VGAGLAALAAIGGLVFLGFRLGRQKKGAGGGSNNAAETTGPFDKDKEGGSPGRVTLAGTAIERGDEQHVGYNRPQLEGTPVAELASSDYPLGTELPGHDVEVDKQPAELCHGILPPELSADAEVPRTRIPGTART
jgi:hypothetical protein